MTAHLEAASRIGIGETYEARQLVHSIYADDSLMIRRLLAQWASGPLGCPRAMGQTEQHLRQRHLARRRLSTWHHGRRALKGGGRDGMAEEERATLEATDRFFNEVSVEYSSATTRQEETRRCEVLQGLPNLWTSGAQIPGI